MKQQEDEALAEVNLCLKPSGALFTAKIKFGLMEVSVRPEVVEVFFIKTS